MNAPRFTVEDLELFVKQGMIAQSAIEEMPEYKRAVRAATRAMTHASGKKRLARPEQDLQHALCQWWALKYVDSWEYTFHTPNGLAAKNRKLAAIFKGLGLKAGVPDLLCLQRRGGCTGFALELKANVGAATKSQYDWADRLREQDYYVAMAWRLEDAMAMVDEYNSYVLGAPRVTARNLPEIKPKYRYAVAEARQLIGISRTQIYQRIRQGRLAAVNDGARVFITDEEIRRYSRTSVHDDKPCNKSREAS